jgi:hypothetical protein
VLAHRLQHKGIGVLIPVASQERCKFGLT